MTTQSPAQLLIDLVRAKVKGADIRHDALSSGTPGVSAGRTDCEGRLFVAFYESDDNTPPAWRLPAIYCSVRGVYCSPEVALEQVVKFLVIPVEDQPDSWWCLL